MFVWFNKESDLFPLSWFLNFFLPFFSSLSLFPLLVFFLLPMDSCVSQPQAFASRFHGAPPFPQFFVDQEGRQLSPFSVLCTFAFRLLSPMLLFLWWLKTPPLHHLHFLLRPYAPACLNFVSHTNCALYLYVYSFTYLCNYPYI